jgi:hypothetical protein
MAYKRITGVDIVSFSTFTGIICSFLGFFYGLIVLVAGSFISALFQSQSEFNFPHFGAALGIAAIIVLPILFFVIGFIVGIIYALIINLALKITRGLKIDLQD